MIDWIGDAANALTALFTGGTLLLAFLAYRGQQKASEPTCFVEIVPYDNAAGIKVTVRNRADHPMRVVAVESRTRGVKLATWRTIANWFVTSIDAPVEKMAVDVSLDSSRRNGNDYDQVLSGVLISNATLPKKIKLRLTYDPLGNGRTKSLVRNIPIPEQHRALSMSVEKPTEEAG